MSLPPISPIAMSGITPIAAPARPAAATAVDGGVGAGFAQYLDQVAGLEKNANQTAVKLATGEISDVHQFTVAAAKAQLAVEMTAAVRNRAVDAFNEIMRMQV